MTDEELKAEVEKKAQERIARCGERIQEILEEENCSLTAEMLIRANQVIPNIIIVSK